MVEEDMCSCTQTDTGRWVARWFHVGGYILMSAMFCLHSIRWGITVMHIPAASSHRWGHLLPPLSLVIGNLIKLRHLLSSCFYLWSSLSLTRTFVYVVHPFSLLFCDVSCFLLRSKCLSSSSETFSLLYITLLLLKSHHSSQSPHFTCIQFFFRLFAGCSRFCAMHEQWNDI